MNTEQVEHFRDGFPVLGLYTDHPRSGSLSHGTALTSLALPEELTASLRLLADAEACSLPVLLLTAGQCLLHRYTLQEDIVLGVPLQKGHSGLALESSENLHWALVPALLEASADAPVGFQSQLRKTTESLVDASSRALPLAELYQAYRYETAEYHPPLFQAGFVYRVSATRPDDAAVLAFWNAIFSGPAPLDIALVITETAGKLQVSFLYNPALFRAATLESLGRHYLNLLTAAAQHPQQAVVRLPLLDAAERVALIEGFNQTQTAYPREVCLHGLFEAQVEKTPEAIALVFADQTLTYRELNARANQLAQHLLKQGVLPDQLVGICIERSVEMVVGLLGILKAGGAYVPLDPTYPRDRLAFMVEDAETSILLTQQHLLDILPPTSALIISLDSDWPEIAKSGTEKPDTAVNSSHLAYMIYTSGSTGRPKGAMNEHRGICNRLLWMQEAYGLNDSDRVLQKTPFSFDVSVWEFFWPLSTGARLVVAKPEGHKDPGYLLDVIDEQHITTLHFVPPMLHVFLEVMDQNRGRSIRRVICSGEALPYDLQQRFFSQSQAELHNLYGPTEAAVDVSYWACQKDSSLRIVPIGRPVANTRLYILDSQSEPVPTGVPGELHIGGIQVGRGYHNRPDLTREKFISNPFAEGRLYRTGDLARFLPDGNIEFLGRIDHQVKIRGFRIELGEIEAALGQHPAVQQAVVLVHQDRHGDKQLAAYLVTDPDWVATEEQADKAGEHVALWQTLYEETYRQAVVAADDPTFNISGWNSTYTGQPIPAEQMREWVEQTVARILSLKPGKVLELGCGTGLLLSRIAPHCESYVGADISETGLNHIRTLKDSVPGLERISLLHRGAHEIDDFATDSLDTVVINSVVQHFPDADYLVKVIQGAARLVRPGGHIFVGDVPNVILRETFNASVQLFRASDEDTVEQVWQRMRQQMDAEKDLQFAPAFFITLARYVPGLAHIQILPKPGYSHNQLTLFRFDVILHLGTAEQVVSLQPYSHDWQEGQTLAAVKQHLTEARPAVYTLRNIPNARLVSEAVAMEQLRAADPSDSVATLRSRLVQPVAGIEPEDLRNIGAELGYQVELSWVNMDEGGRYDALFTSMHDTHPAYSFGMEMPRGHWSDYAFNPHTAKVSRMLIPRLKTHLGEHLPDYMVPDLYTLIEVMPLSPSGKIDRKALEKLSQDAHPVREQALIAAHSPLEKLLVDTWIEVLDVSPIGIEDNFFVLGGNSLKAMIVANKLQRLFNRSLPPLVLFNAPTVAGLAAHLMELHPDLALPLAGGDNSAEREEGEI